jgi:hypothetical protein
VLYSIRVCKGAALILRGGPAQVRRKAGPGFRDAGRVESRLAEIPQYRGEYDRLFKCDSLSLSESSYRFNKHKAVECVYYIADARLKVAVEKFTVDLALKCRTVYQLYKLYKQGLVTQKVGERAREILETECPKDLIELIAPTVD